MPELPDIEAYRTAIEREIVGRTLVDLRIDHPFLLRSVDVPPERAIGKPLSTVGRLGKRLVLHFGEAPLFVLHLMVAGRLQWKIDPGTASLERGPARAARSGVLARFAFEGGRLTLTESGSKRRASLHVIADADALADLDPGGLEPLAEATTVRDVADRLRAANHTIKRSLTDPRLFSGIGNAYSDEILFHARLSPFAMTQSMNDDEIGRLFTAIHETLGSWTDLLVGEAKRAFPKKVTAFRPEMRVHGKYNEPCTVCGTPIQRIRYAENECNYCPTCQSGGKVYADRALSRLLKNEWPRSVEELERLNRPPTSR